MSEETPPGHSGSTAWARSIASQFGRYLKTETASSGILLAAIVVAVLWASVAGSSYEDFWSTRFVVQLGTWGIDLDLREWVSQGLMTFFFLVVGLEARREIDLGDLRDRSKLLIPFVAGLAGMLLPVLLFLAINAGGDGAVGWGVAMSTDTALALGLVAILGRGLPERLRGFMVTLFIVDDLVALLVIALVYSTDIQVVPLLIAVGAWALFPLMMRYTKAPTSFYVAAGFLCWGALLFSGVDPVVAGLAIGLVAPAYSPGRNNLEEASGLFRSFREQPTPQLARTASAGLINAISPNERLQSRYLPWTSYVIVPLFALANAGIAIDPAFLATAYAAPITIGIIVGYVVGKPVAIFGVARLITALTRGKVKPPVGWAAVAGSGTIAGVGFTVAVLIANLAFTGEQLDQAKLGILTAALLSAVITFVLFRITNALSVARRSRALFGETEQLVDLADAVDARRDHIRGPDDAPVTIVEYGDFQCPYCGRAEPEVRMLLSDTEVRFVWRHLPLVDVHPAARMAAEAAEAAGAQGSFWEMHDILLANQDCLEPEDLNRYAAELGLDVERFESDITSGRHLARVMEDTGSADLSGVSGTPTFFINGRRHYGAYDVESLRAAVRAERDLAFSAR
ncbi:Na+/H+ antiporter NhaA [Leifsonia poae]|uniref:Na(+)/H(+) antiporter NhaA n=1 Tax=Leifsonia poae TaxID=110933 RepID=A0A9W6HA47_9MICO|nr:Na+/H+ antiporter NhaA [Leifsonia poae]GLJ76088.1 Na(+)/H(+) antiporter NhaA 2 [Leifsonia poae]